MTQAYLLAAGLTSWAYWDKTIEAGIKAAVVAASAWAGVQFVKWIDRRARPPLTELMRDRRRRFDAIESLVLWVLDLGSAFLMYYLGWIARWGLTESHRNQGWLYFVLLTSFRFYVTSDKPAVPEKRRAFFPNHREMANYITVIMVAMVTYDAVVKRW